MLPRPRRALTPTLVFASSLFGTARRRARGGPTAAARRRAHRARPAQAGRGRQRALRRRPPRRREHRAARLARQRRAACAPRYLSITRGDGGQNLDRRRAGRAARRHPHPGAARRAAHRRRRAVLHPRARLRLLEEPRGDAAHLGQGRGAGRRGGGHPPLPARRHHHPLLARAGRHHGHHTASAMLAVEAFRAAADPRVSPSSSRTA